jgi:hypothetical protein
VEFKTVTAESGTALWLYGSCARGDNDPLSDRDLLVVADADVEMPSNAYPNGIMTDAVSCYQWREIEAMAAYGSLFLRHVWLEGKRLFESDEARGRLEGIVASMGPYRLAARDAQAFRVVLKDVRRSIDSAGSLVYELSVLATVFRHGSILACHLSGTDCFGRVKPVEKLVRLWSMPESWAASFPQLYEFRLFAAGRIGDAPHATAQLTELWLARTEWLIDRLTEEVDAVD